MKSLIHTFCIVLVLLVAPRVLAIDLAEGLMMAVPAQPATPSLDGTDTGWDLSAAEPIWASPQTIRQINGQLALNYNDQALYLHARMALPNRPYQNVNSSLDAFWNGDGVELRLCSDPSIPYPLNMNNPAIEGSDRICHMVFWKNTQDGKAYLNIDYGGVHHNKRGKAVNPAGSVVSLIDLPGGYLIEAKIPWSAMHVPDGKNPFHPGDQMTAIWGAHWKTADWFMSVPGLYSENPGDFAFLQWQMWGRVEFSANGNLPPRHATLDQMIAKADAASGLSSVGVPITINVPTAGKLSVNIFDSNGGVIRELCGGQTVSPGKFTVYWDGHDQWGWSVAVGSWKWGAYLSGGLKAQYAGCVGSSGNPPYSTPDGNGGWGGDHNLPICVAADESGIYFGWDGAEAQRQLVKVAYDGHTLWRKSPNVGGGSVVPGVGSVYALASNGQYLFGAYSGSQPVLVRLDAATGLFATCMIDNVSHSSVPIAQAPIQDIPVPVGSYPPHNGNARDCTGLAASKREVFAALYPADLIQVFDTQTMLPIRQLSCRRPRGLALDSAGNLYAACYDPDAKPTSSVVRFDAATGAAKPIVTQGLEAVIGVAVQADGTIAVTDGGSSQQVKIFSPEGKLINTIGKPGGRPWMGKVDPGAFLWPTAIVADAQGGLVLSETSIPKIFDRIVDGKVTKQWFGWPGYGVSNIADCDDPWTCYFPYEPQGFGRARVTADGQSATCDAYWDLKRAGVEGVNEMFGEGALPYVQTLSNGRKYFIDDSSPHGICLIDGDSMIPVGHLAVYLPGPGRYPRIDGLKQETLELWIDRNGDHEPQPDEVTSITSFEGKPLSLGFAFATLWLDKQGNAYILCPNDCILKVPSDGFSPEGCPLWNLSKISYAVPCLIPSTPHLGASGRVGVSGVRTDDQGNLYACISARVPALTPALAATIQKQWPDLPKSQWCAYATEALAKHMHEGLGHTAETSAVKFAKYGPDGKMLWIAGRKATAQPYPGEMYHFWAMAGMVNNDYVVGGSEWGMMYFYTSDGFYVDSIMNDPATMPPPGPYTFGSETFAGRVQAFPALKQVFAYSEGNIYHVQGFDDQMKVAGEIRLWGNVQLDKVYEAPKSTATQVATTIQIAPIVGDPATASAWNKIPTETLHLGSSDLATAQLAYDTSHLYANFHVVDDTPLQNSADDLSLIFKGGDAVGLDLGPAGDRKSATAGDLRILAAMIRGQPHIVGMKIHSARDHQPQTYQTGGGGTRNFDFVGEIPGAIAVLKPDPDGKGYTALLTIPREFLELPLASGIQLKGDLEVLLSGNGPRGLQAVSRNWINSGGHVETTMTDDVPTESWLYPQFWGDVSVK